MFRFLPCLDFVKENEIRRKLLYDGKIPVITIPLICNLVSSYFLLSLHVLYINATSYRSIYTSISWFEHFNSNILRENYNTTLYLLKDLDAI